MKDWIPVPRRERLLVVGGLLIGVLIAPTGAAFESPDVQLFLYAAGGMGWVIATAILMMRHTQRGDWMIAAGFMVLAFAETLLWVGGTPGDLESYDPAFATGAMFYGPGLLLVVIPAAYGRAIRLSAILGAVAWTVFTAQYLAGSDVPEIQGPLTAGYLLLSAFFLGVAALYARGRGPWRETGPSAMTSTELGARVV
jgi:hypothetical protein